MCKHENMHCVCELEQEKEISSAQVIWCPDCGAIQIDKEIRDEGKREEYYMRRRTPKFEGATV